MREHVAWTLECRTYCSVTAKLSGREVSPLPVRSRTRRCGRIPRSQMASAVRLLKERSRNYGTKIKDGRVEALCMTTMLICEVGANYFFFFNLLGSPITHKAKTLLIPWINIQGLL